MQLEVIAKLCSYKDDWQKFTGGKMVAIRQTHSSTFDFAKWVDE